MKNVVDCREASSETKFSSGGFLTSKQFEENTISFSIFYMSHSLDEGIQHRAYSVKFVVKNNVLNLPT